MIKVEDITNINTNFRLLDDRYQILYTIGQGRYAKVKLGIDKETGKRVAIKIMRESSARDEDGLESFINEVKILSLVTPHHNIVQLLRVCLNGKYTKCDGRSSPVIYYVMKIAENGELFKFLMHTTKFEENFSRFFFIQLIQSLESLHKEGVAHRDIKPENILIDQNMNLQLCDFGFSVLFKGEDGLIQLFDPYQPSGSPEYNPPEVTQESFAGVKYSAEAMDIFASGCVLFMMAMSSAPFANTRSTDRYYSRFCMENKASFWKIFAFNHKPTNEFKDLIHRMLEPDPQKRLTIQKIKDHPWMNGPVPSIEEVREEMKERIRTVQEKTLEELKQKSSKNEQVKKQKAIPQEIRGFEQLKMKYSKEIEEINKTLSRKSQIQKKKNKQQSSMKQAQPDDKESEPQPIEECLLKNKQDYVIEQKEKDIKTKGVYESSINSNNIYSSHHHHNSPHLKKDLKNMNTESTFNFFEEHKQEDAGIQFEERRGDSSNNQDKQTERKDIPESDSSKRGSGSFRKSPSS